MSNEFKFFEVVLPNNVDTAATGEGFIDSRNPDSFSSLPSTLANSTNKERANMRWAEIVKMLQETGSSDVIDVVETGGDENTAPTSITFKIKYRGEQTVWLYDLVTDLSARTVYGPQSTLQIASQQGYTYTDASEEAVIERAIATALSQNQYTDSREIYDPTESGMPASPRYTDKFVTVTVSPLGTGASQSARMTNIEGVSQFTVTRL